MPGIGTYDPTDTRHATALWSYGEVPVRSLKLNQWDGNIAASFALVHQVAALLLAGDDGPKLIASSDTGGELKVNAAPSPDLTVRIAPGYLFGDGWIAGLTEIETLPTTGEFIPPSANPHIDTVALTSSGELVVVTGTEAASPVAPDTPTDSVKLAEIFHHPAETSIKDSDDATNGYIIDARPEPLCGEAHRHNTDRSPAEFPDGSRTSFTKSEHFVDGTLEVFLNGVLQVPGAGGDFEENADGDGYEFAEPPETGDDIAHHYLVHPAN